MNAYGSGGESDFLIKKMLWFTVCDFSRHGLVCGWSPNKATTRRSASYLQPNLRLNVTILTLLAVFIIVMIVPVLSVSI